MADIITRGTGTWKIIDSDLNEYSIKESLREEPEQQEIYTDVLTTEYSGIENNYFGQGYKTTIYIFKPTTAIFSEYKKLVNKLVTFYPNEDNNDNVYSCKVLSVRPFRKSNTTKQQMLKIELESSTYVRQYIKSSFLLIDWDSLEEEWLLPVDSELLTDFTTTEEL